MHKLFSEKLVYLGSLTKALSLWGLVETGLIFYITFLNVSFMRQDVSERH
jgi:hypothetical protein